MKILVIANQGRYEKYMPDKALSRQHEIVYCPVGTADAELLDKAGDAQVILADAIAKVDADLIGKMPQLLLIHSEGAAYDKIDTEAAAARKIWVCNNQGANAQAVAEQAILLMLGLLRFVEEGNKAVLEGHQIDMKEAKMLSGIEDLCDCTVGLIGFGNIAKEVAVRLHAFGCQCYYYTAHRKSPEVEAQYHVEYLPMEELLPRCDIVSLHAAVTPETVHMMDSAHLAMMKEGAYLINTARGDLIDEEALVAALASGHIQGAGLDTLSPEPVRVDDPLVAFSRGCPYRVLFSPHIGGVTSGCFRRMHSRMWKNVEAVSQGERPDCVVNGL